MIDKDRSADTLAAFCHNGSVATCFMNSFMLAFAEDAERSTRGDKRRLVEYHDAAGPYIHDNRARIARYFLDHTDYQWLWMLDNDIEFPTDTLYRLIDAAEEHDAKILAAGYWIRYGKGNTYLSWLLISEEGIRALPSMPDTEGLVEVTAVGMGCTLIHRDVVQDVVDYQRANFPDDPWDSFGADLLRYEDGHAERMGEDVTFCMRARRLGHRVYGLPTLEVEHFKPSYISHGPAALHDHDSRDAEGGTSSAPNGHEDILVPTLTKE